MAEQDIRENAMSGGTPTRLRGLEKTATVLVRQWKR